MTSQWPFTWRCLDCGYIGWPNTTDLKGGGARQSCPRSSRHPEMQAIKITAHEVVGPQSGRPNGGTSA